MKATPILCDHCNRLASHFVSNGTAGRSFTCQEHYDSEAHYHLSKVNDQPEKHLPSFDLAEKAFWKSWHAYATPAEKSGRRMWWERGENKP